MKDRASRFMAGLALALAVIGVVVALMAYVRAADSTQASQQTTKSAPSVKSSKKTTESKDELTNDALIASGDLPSAQTKTAVSSFDLALANTGKGNVTECYKRMEDFRSTAISLEHNQQMWLSSNNYPSKDVSSNLLVRSHLRWICDLAKGHKGVDVTYRPLINETYEVRKDWLAITEALSVGDVTKCTNTMKDYRTEFSKLSIGGKILIGDMSLPATSDAFTDPAIDNLCTSGAPDNA